MTECHRLAAILIAILFTTASCAKKAQQRQSAGWANTRWGMTEQQIRELYPEARAVQQNLNIKGEQARLRVDKFQLDGKQFLLQFFFDSAGGLHEVNLLQRADDVIDCIPMSSTCDRLEELLNQKYGKPSLRTAHQGVEERRVVWNTPDMIVSLDYFPVGVAKECSLFVTYKRPGSDALDHL
jgi:hypothetical protein